MLTIFAVPKPFHDHIGVIQRNAIRSWTSLRPACEVILMGNEEGTAEVAAEFGVRHVPDVARNTFGTPLVSDLFQQAQQLSGRNLFCYVNSDIVLMSDFMEAVQRVSEQKNRFLLVAHRWNLDVKEVFEFKSDWEEKLRTRAKEFGTLAGVTSLDVFVFPRGLLGEIPAFAVGRPGWDNWMLYRTRSLSVPLVDAPPVVTAVHQNHHYSHHPQGKTGLWNGDEALICTCFCVSERVIETEIAEKGLATVSEVIRACNAGGGCGSCHPLIQELLEASGKTVSTETR